MSDVESDMSKLWLYKVLHRFTMLQTMPLSKFSSKFQSFMTIHLLPKCEDVDYTKVDELK